MKTLNVGYLHFIFVTEIDAMLFLSLNHHLKIAPLKHGCNKTLSETCI